MIVKANTQVNRIVSQRIVNVVKSVTAIFPPRDVLQNTDGITIQHTDGTNLEHTE